MSEDQQTGRGGGIASSLKRLLESASGFLATKLELIGIEIQEEKRRVFELLILAAATLLSAALALLVLTFAVIVYFWDTPCRMATILSVGAIYTLLFIFLLGRLQRKANIGTKVFETTVEELKKDSEWMKRRL